MRAAAIQLNSTADKGRNLVAAERLVREAAADGAELIALPEKWNVLGDAEALHDGAEPLGGPTLKTKTTEKRSNGRWVGDVVRIDVIGRLVAGADSQRELICRHRIGHHRRRPTLPLKVGCKKPGRQHEFRRKSIRFKFLLLVIGPGAER